MGKSSTDTKSDRARSTSRSTLPFHFATHKTGYHLESCCGICNLFPGVLLIAFCQVLVGSVLLTLLLTNGKEYDEMHQTPNSQMMSLLTGGVLSGVTGAGLLLVAVALTENCRAMLIYLMVATLIFVALTSLSLVKIGRGCSRFYDAPKVKDEQHKIANLACVSGLMTFFGAVLYFFSLLVVFSFYHFRYVRRAILLHEAECD
ncbi:uncharacterized protein LOC121727830 [Aricia agestis]|uniref:uncharacterized protein LOC121727830 n=1 Tax=Aricia agestis TaxID=91739 RepID=UPI001C20463B|nr:uncharacterized protein LOC121727830 [Aricia agestis]